MARPDRHLGSVCDSERVGGSRLVAHHGTDALPVRNLRSSAGIQRITNAGTDPPPGRTHFAFICRDVADNERKLRRGRGRTDPSGNAGCAWVSRGWTPPIMCAHNASRRGQSWRTDRHVGPLDRSRRRGMVVGMATRKVTVTLEEDQLARIRGLVAAGNASTISGFVQHAVSVALDDVAGWGAMLADALAKTGGSSRLRNGCGPMKSSVPVSAGASDRLRDGRDHSRCWRSRRLGP